MESKASSKSWVAPHAGAWIEIKLCLLCTAAATTSHPTRVRGLKWRFICSGSLSISEVAPHAGAWIEIKIWAQKSCPCSVAPHAGAWIEITSVRENRRLLQVAPHAGAWIEIE